MMGKGVRWRGRLDLTHNHFGSFEFRLNGCWTLFGNTKTRRRIHRSVDHIKSRGNPQASRRVSMKGDFVLCFIPTSTANFAYILKGRSRNAMSISDLHRSAIVNHPYTKRNGVDIIRHSVDKACCGVEAEKVSEVSTIGFSFSHFNFLLRAHYLTFCEPLLFEQFDLMGA